MVTNEFERDLNDQAGLKRPGRVDFRVFQNTADAGDGNPGVQRCFRNYLHEGGMEKDLDLIGHGIKGTSVDLTNAKLQEFNNIGSTTIDGTQWGYLGELDQPLKQSDSPTFDSPTISGLTVNGDIIITGNVDGVDISDFKTNYDSHKASTGADHSYIDQSVIIASSPTFVGLTLSANIVTSSTVDGVDISDFKTEFEAFNAIGSGNAQYIGCSYEHSTQYGQIFMKTDQYIQNSGGTTNTTISFDIPLPCNKGPYSLKLDDLILIIVVADSNDKIIQVEIIGVNNNSAPGGLYSSFVSRESAGTYTYDLSDINCSEYWKLSVQITTNLNSVDGLKFFSPIIKYFYS